MSSYQPACVVLGGGGFLGTNLCRRLAATGVRVRAFGRTRLFPDDLNGVHWHQGNFDDTGALASAIESCETVFHLIHAKMPNAANLDMAGDILESVIPSLALLDTCRKLKVRRLVFV